MTLAIQLPQRNLRLVESEEDSPLVQRIDTTSISDRVAWMTKIVAEKVPYKNGRCNLRSYERINDCYDVIEEIELVPMRRIYQEHGAKTGRISDISLYDSSNIFMKNVKNSREALTACLVLQGSLTLEYKKKGFHVPVKLTEGNIFMWDSSISVGFDNMKGARIAVYGVI